MPVTMAGTVSFDDVEALVDTGDALLCVIEGNEVWIPSSQIHADSEVFEKGQVGKLVVTEWIAMQKGLI
jgi:hypothetical protein